MKLTSIRVECPAEGCPEEFDVPVEVWANPTRLGGPEGEIIVGLQIHFPDDTMQVLTEHVKTHPINEEPVDAITQQGRETSDGAQGEDESKQARESGPEEASPAIGRN